MDGWKGTKKSHICHASYLSYKHSTFNGYRILNLVHDVDKSEKEILECCAQQLKRLAQFNSAAEVLEKLGDIKALVSLHIETQQWHYVSKSCLHMYMHV